MYPLYFYICLLASTACLVVLILLAVFPIKLPLVPKTTKIIKRTKPTHSQRKARSPTQHLPTISYWDTWDDDEDL